MVGPVVVCDFDGTLTDVDVGDAICDRFADPSWQEIDRQWVRGELSLPEAQRRMWKLVDATVDELCAYAHEIGDLRSGADELLDLARRGAVELILASGGFGIYIEPILGERLALFAARYYSDVQLRTEGGFVPVLLEEDLACAKCHVCKGSVVRRHRRIGAPVIFVGDGSSDCCAAPEADQIFAVRGGQLAQHCAEQGISYSPFDSLEEVAATIANPVAKN